MNHWRRQWLSDQLHKKHQNLAGNGKHSAHSSHQAKNGENTKIETRTFHRE